MSLYKLKTPCKECITMAICRIEARDLLNTSILDCPLVRKFVDACDGIGNEAYQTLYRQRRINEVKEDLGVK